MAQLWPESFGDEDRLRHAKAAYNRMVAAAHEYERVGKVEITILVDDVEDGEAALVPELPQDEPAVRVEPQPRAFQPGVIQGTPITII